MTTYKKNDRRQWRHTLKRLQWRFNYALALLALLAAILVQPAPASAQARWDYQPQFGRAPRCVALEVQP